METNNLAQSSGSKINSGLGHSSDLNGCLEPAT